METNAIEIKGLTKHYKDFSLENLDLTLPAGCVLGLVGENGAGKSTTIRLIMDAKSIYGMNNAQIGRIVGLDRVQISRYANGQCGMSAPRAAKVIHQLTDALSQMQEAQ